MDVTSIFRSALEAVKKKKLESNDHAPEPTPLTVTKPKIFPERKSEFYTQAAELRRKITKLRDFLNDTKTAYLNVGNGVLRTWKRGDNDWNSKDMNSLTDNERDQVDEDVQKIIHACQQQIFDFERVVQRSDMVTSYPQLRTHLDNVQNSLVDYLKEVCEIHSEMRAIRVKRTVNYKHLSKIAHHTNATTSVPPGLTRASKVSSNVHDHDVDESDSKTRSTGHREIENQLSPEELQMYEEENSVLLHELNTLAEEVDQIETSVVKIAQLQEVFTEKVLQQDKDVNKITDLVVGATENVRDGNEQIRQSIQKKADFRAWVLFFIIVMSFSLLFLDWYND